MKCEKCNEREATYFYRESVNGKTTKRCLCAECAKEEGMDRVFEERSREMQKEFEDFWNDSWFRPMFDRPFRWLPSGFARTMPMLMPFAFPVFELHGRDHEQEKEHEPEKAEAPQAKTEAPAEDAAAKAKAEAEEKARKEALRAEREELRQRMEEAARNENYELAIELRDKLRAMPEE